MLPLKSDPPPMLTKRDGGMVVEVGSEDAVLKPQEKAERQQAGDLLQESKVRERLEEDDGGEDCGGSRDMAGVPTTVLLEAWCDFSELEALQVVSH